MDAMPDFVPSDFMHAVTCDRGRLPQPETNVLVRHFTVRELDAIAPLSLRHRQSIANNNPTPEAEESLAARVRAAKLLKYGAD